MTSASWLAHGPSGNGPGRRPARRSRSRARTRNTSALASYARTIRRGSCARAPADGASPLTMWPRKAGSGTPSTSSKGLLRGLANWPPIRPTRNTGPSPPSSSARAWSTAVLARTWSVPVSSKLSAQSPSWTIRAPPAATTASARRSRASSAAVTSAGAAASAARLAT